MEIFLYEKYWIFNKKHLCQVQNKSNHPFHGKTRKFLKSSLFSSKIPKKVKVLCLFSKAMWNWSIIKNPKTSRGGCFQNAQRDIVRIFIIEIFLIALEKTGYVLVNRFKLFIMSIFQNSQKIILKLVSFTLIFTISPYYLFIPRSRRQIYFDLDKISTGSEKVATGSESHPWHHLLITTGLLLESGWTLPQWMVEL